jgi:hypothetical protein
MDDVYKNPALELLKARRAFIEAELSKRTDAVSRQEFPATAEEINLPEVEFKVEIRLSENGRLSVVLPQDSLPLTPQEKADMEEALLYGLHENLRDDRNGFLNWVGENRYKEVTLVIQGRIEFTFLGWRLGRHLN